MLYYYCLLQIVSSISFTDLYKVTDRDFEDTLAYTYFERSPLYVGVNSLSLVIIIFSYFLNFLV